MKNLPSAQNSVAAPWLKGISLAVIAAILLGSANATRAVHITDECFISQAEITLALLPAWTQLPDPVLVSILLTRQPGNPFDTKIRRTEGDADGDGLTDYQTEILQMVLAGQSSIGEVIVRKTSGIGAIEALAQTAGFHSFFDVFFDIETSMGTLFNKDPLRMAPFDDAVNGIFFVIPPIGLPYSPYQSPVPWWPLGSGPLDPVDLPLPLYDTADPNGPPHAELISVIHTLERRCPDGGSSLLLLGSALATLACFRSRRSKTAKTD